MACYDPNQSCLTPQSDKSLNNELGRFRRDERNYYDQVKTNTLSKFGAPDDEHDGEIQNSRGRAISLTPVGIQADLLRRPRSLPDFRASAQEYPSTGDLSGWVAVKPYKRPPSSMVKKEPLLKGHSRMWVGQVVRERGAVNINDPEYLSMSEFYMDENKVETSTQTYAPIIAKDMENKTTRANVNSRQARNEFLAFELVDKVNSTSDLDYVANPYPRSVMTPEKHNKAIAKKGIAVKHAFQNDVQKTVSKEHSNKVLSELAKARQAELNVN
jgi:hypothetical protein